MAQLKDDTEPPDIEELLSDLGIQLDRLKQLYEMYFLGIEKLEPLVARKQVQRAMLGLQQLSIRNTGLRFKFNSLLQKWNIYQTYWGRTVREIENGTYVRHLAKARRAAEREGKDLPLEVLRIRERIAAAQVHAETQPPSPGAPEPKPPSEATARLAAAEARATKREEYNEFADMRAFLDVDTDSFPRVEDEDDEPAPAAAKPVAIAVVAPARPSAQPSPAAPPPRTPAAPPPPRPPPPPGARPGATQTTPAVPPPPPRPSATQTTPAVPPRPAATPVPPRPTATQTTPAVRPAVTIPGMDERELRDLHQRYVASRKATGEGANVSYDSLVSSLAKQVPKVLEQKGAKAVRFEVVTQNGKTILKAIPQK